MKKLLISFVVCGIVLLGNWDAIAEDPAAVVAKVNDKEILQSEVDLFMNALALPQLRARNQGKEISPEQKQQVRQDIINQLINQKLILNVASDLKISLDQKIVNERFEGSKARYQGIEHEKLKKLKLVGLKGFCERNSTILGHRRQLQSATVLWRIKNQKLFEGR